MYVRRDFSSNSIILFADVIWNCAAFFRTQEQQHPLIHIVRMVQEKLYSRRSLKYSDTVLFEKIESIQEIVISHIFFLSMIMYMIVWFEWQIGYFLFHYIFFFSYHFPLSFFMLILGFFFLIISPTSSCSYFVGYRDWRRRDFCSGRVVTLSGYRIWIFTVQCDIKR